MKKAKKILSIMAVLLVVTCVIILLVVLQFSSKGVEYAPVETETSGNTELYSLKTEVSESANSQDFPKSGLYESGHLFSFHVKKSADPSFYVFLNGEMIQKKSSGKVFSGYVNYEITMPQEDSVLELNPYPYSKNRDYFSEFFPWASEVTTDNLVKTKFETSYDTDSSSYWSPFVMEGTDPDDLECKLNFLKNGILKYYSDYDSDDSIETITVTYVLSNGDEFEMSFQRMKGDTLVYRLSDDGEDYYFILNEKASDLDAIYIPLYA